MCGLFGVISNHITVKDEAIFKELGIVSNLRGMHSTGAGMVRQDNVGEYQYFTAKAVGTMYDLMYTKDFDRLLGFTNKRVLLGHARYATKGVINKANCHPFINANILGAHNGTVHSGITNANHYHTDSEGIMAMFEDIGVEATVPKLLGAWAFTWWDFRNNSFNILRNKERTLYYTFDKANQTMYYASEYEMLELVLIRNGINFGDVESFNQDVLYTWNVTKDADWANSEERKEIKGKEVIVTPHIPFRADTVSATQSTGADTTKPKTSTGTHSAYNTRWYHVRHNRNSVVGMKGDYISRSKYDKVLDGGCAWCSSSIDQGDKFKWLTNEDILCEACCESPVMTELLSTNYLDA